MSLSSISPSWRVVVAIALAALGACAEQHTRREDVHDSGDPPVEDAGTDAQPDASRDMMLADGGVGSLLDAAADSAFCDDMTALNSAYARAVQAGKQVGCQVDADCVLEREYSACALMCSFALPDAGLARYRELRDRDVYPLCTVRDEAGCQRPPLPGCPDVVPACNRGQCETRARE